MKVMFFLKTILKLTFFLICPWYESKSPDDGKTYISVSLYPHYVILNKKRKTQSSNPRYNGVVFKVLNWVWAQDLNHDMVGPNH